MAELPDLGAVYRYEKAAADGDTAHLTILALHDAGGDEESLVATARRIAPEAGVVSLRGPVEAEGGGWRHLPVRTVDKPTNTDDVDPHVEAVHARAAELRAWLAQAVEALDLDDETVCVLGFGDGATAAVALAYDFPDAVAGAVVLSGRAPFRAPGGRILDHKQVFCATGRLDESVTMDDYEELVEGLVTAGADVELHWYDIGHETSGDELDDAGTWLRKRLAAPEPEPAPEPG